MFNPNFSRRVTALIALLIVIALFPLVATLAHEGGPHLRFAHLAPDAPAVDIYVNGQALVKGLKYKDQTDYKSVEGGDFEFVIVPAGGKITDSVTEKPIKITFKASEGRFYSLAVIGSLKDKTLDLFHFAADRGAEIAATPDAHDDHDAHDADHMATMEATKAK
jgi:hypothetical protein